MTANANIEFQPESGKYILTLPESVYKTLGLTDTEGKPISIVNENKMQLEWLSQKIMGWFHDLNTRIMSTRSRLNRKKRVAVLILFISILIAFLNHSLSRITHIDILYINLSAFGFGMICILQLFKYFALGLTGYGMKSNAEDEINDLKQLIQKDYST